MGTLSSQWSSLLQRRCYSLLLTTAGGSLLFSLLLSSLMRLLVWGHPGVWWGWWLLQSVCTAVVTAGIGCLLVGSCRVSARVAYNWRQLVRGSLSRPPALAPDWHFRVPTAAVCLLLVPCGLMLLRLQFGWLLHSRPGSITYRCSAALCLDESALLLTVAALINSLFVAGWFLTRHGDLLLPPFVQLPRSRHMVSLAEGSVLEAFKDSWYVARYLLPIYWLLGGRLSAALAAWMSVQRDDTVVSPDSLLAMIWPVYTASGVTVWLPGLVLLTGLVVRLPLVLTRALLPELLAARLPAPLTAVSSPTDACGLVLPSALGRAGPNQPLLDWLSWHEMARLVRASTANQRAVLFQLSLPGDHAHTCNHLFSSGLRIITEVCDALQKTATKSATPLAPSENGRNGVSGPGVVMSPLLAPQHLGTQHRGPVTKSYMVDASEVLVEKGQPVCWALDILTEISAVALQEDSFGATQRHLAPLFSAVLRLSTVLDPLCRSSSGLCTAALATFRQLLHSNRASLHRLSALYLPHLSALELDSDTVSLLTAYAHYSK